MRREGFTASDSSVLCSEHFKQEDLDRTGQIIRIRDGVVPSIFSFPVHLQRPEKGRTTSTSRRADDSLSVAFQEAPKAETSQPQPNEDHEYALPASPTSLKARLNEDLARVESLERQRKNSMAREKRAKTTVKSLLGDLRDNSLINEELKERLEFYSDSSRGCVARLSFSCPLKGHYCLYPKSCFSLTSRQPHQWIHLMLLHLQSKSSVPLSSQHECVQRLAALWEKTKLKGAHSFTLAMTQHSTLHRKDFHSLQTQLEEVRFFDLFGPSEQHRGWLCFMCNNPEKATVVNQDGQPLIEGNLKEKQIRWRFIKRWKTRYFTLAGNQLLFRKGGKSKDEMDDVPIELSKVQSVKVVARKRRDRALPRAFEIFTDSKTYVLKAKDEKHAEEWLQCINVAVAQARERERVGDSSTYL